MRVLLEAGADINAVDCTGSTPLHQTAIATDTTSARFLLEHQANPNVRDQNGCTPLHLACWYRYFDRRAADTALLLLAHGADANVRENQGETSLHKAVEENMPKYAKVLLRHGADPTLADDRGRTARSIAEEKGHLEIVDILDRYDRGEPLEQPALSMDRFEEDIDLDLEIDLDGPNSPSQTILRRNDLDLYRCRASAGRTADDDGHFQPKPLLDLEIECTDSPPHYPLAPPTQPEPDPRGAETPVGDAGFSVRTSNYLQYIGIKTIGDIANCTESELLAFRHFGKKSLMEVKAKLALYNLSLKAEG